MNGPEWWTIAGGAKGRVEREEQKTPHQTAQIGRPRDIQLAGEGEEVGRIVQGVHTRRP